MIKKNKLLILFICLIIGYFISGCKKNETKKLIEEKRINIQIQTAMTTILTPFLSSNGTLKSYDSVSVSSEAIGILEKVYVTEGSIVSKQMLLAEINSSDYFLEYERAKLTLQQLKARLDNAKISYDRERELIKFDATTREKLDLVKTEYITSKVEVEKAKVLISSARLNLNRTKIYSPLSGIVNLKKVSAGDYVRTGMELFVIISNNPIKLHFSIPEKDIWKIKSGQKVDIEVSAFPNKKFKSYINMIFPSLEEKTRTIQVEALIDNPDNSLKPGLFAKVNVFLGKPKSIVTIPITSLLYEADKVKVFVVEGDTVKERIIKIGDKYGELMEVIEGIKNGEKVVVAGKENLANGIKISIGKE